VRLTRNGSRRAGCGIASPVRVIDVRSSPCPTTSLRPRSRRSPATAS
jgi:hypothetical protein